MSLESRLQALFLLAAPAGLPRWRFFRRNIGEAKMRGGYTVQFGIKGQADLYALSRSGGHLECELKSAGKKLTPDQKIWRDWCLEWGVPHIVLTALKGETDDETIARWISLLAAAVEATPSR